MLPVINFLAEIYNKYVIFPKWKINKKYIVEQNPIKILKNQYFYKKTKTKTQIAELVSLATMPLPSVGAYWGKLRSAKVELSTFVLGAKTTPKKKMDNLQQLSTF